MFQPLYIVLKDDAAAIMNYELRIGSREMEEMNMQINSVNPCISTNSKELNVKENNKKSNENAAEAKDEYIPAQKADKKITYEKPAPKADEVTIQRLKEESDRAYSNLKQLVTQLLEGQGMKFNESKGIEVSEKIQLEAQASIAEGGELSPEKVSDRIVEYAKALSGGDKEKIGLLRSNIEEAFKEAAKILGGELPEISKKTYELVTEKLDAWEKE